MLPCRTTRDKFRNWAQRVGEGEVSAVNAGNGEGMVFANNIVRALLSVCSQCRAMVWVIWPLN